MIIRIQSPDGMSRVNIDNSALYSDLYSKTKEVSFTFENDIRIVTAFVDSVDRKGMDFIQRQSEETSSEELEIKDQP